ncbi:MAG: hypothetical protein LBK71_06665 [Verrucomicrobiales bacterium]|jgi:hypothetical protein|nr:hypothetical protein [Verrucomicrobiales bacterium]
MSFFKKADPLTAARRRLEEEQRAVERQIADLEDALQNPPAPAPPPAAPAKRGAVFKHDPFAAPPAVSGPPLKRRARRVPARVILLCVALVVLILLIRCAG